MTAERRRRRLPAPRRRRDGRWRRTEVSETAEPRTRRCRRSRWPPTCAAPTTAICPAAPTRSGAALSDVVGGPVGRHALIGRHRFLTPLRVMFAIALVFLALGWIDQGGVPADRRHRHRPTSGWRTGQNQRAYYELCYSDTVPLYGAELLSQGKFPYKSSWLETDAAGKPQTQYDGTPAVRYMEYPVLTGRVPVRVDGVGQDLHRADQDGPLPVVAEVVMFFNIAAFGLALAWLATVWATAQLAGRRVWDAALVAASPMLIFQIFTNFDALATAFAIGAMLAWARRQPVLAGVLIGLGVAAKLYPLLLLVPLLVLGVRTGRLRGGGARRRWPRSATWLVVNLPMHAAVPARLVGVLPAQHPPRRRHGLAVQRGEVVHRLAGLRREPRLLAAAGDAERRCRGAVRVVLCGNRLHRADRAAAAAGRAVGVPGGGGVPADQQGVEPAVLAVAGAAGGAGAAAPPDPVGVDDDRRAGVGAADATTCTASRTAGCPSSGSPRRCCCATSRWWCCARWWSARSTGPSWTWSAGAAASTTRPGGVFDRAPDAPPTWLPQRLRPRALRSAAWLPDRSDAERTRDPESPRLRCRVRERISLVSARSCNLGRLPTQATLLPRTRRGRTDHRR